VAVIVEYSLSALCERDGRVSINPQRQAFMEMVDAHGPAVMGMLRRMCRNNHDAEDVFQETAIRVWRNFASRPRLRNPRAWLMTIAYRTFLDQKVRGRRQHESFVDAPDTRSESPLEKTSKADEVQNMLAAMEDLPEMVREVVVLHYSGGLSLRETAAVLGISTGTVKSRLNAALVKLRSVLA
jgi:RNA polymerase sigma-70 factor (ECF subfamily)